MEYKGYLIINFGTFTVVKKCGIEEFRSKEETAFLREKACKEFINSKSSK